MGHPFSQSEREFQSVEHNLSFVPPPTITRTPSGHTQAHHLHAYRLPLYPNPDRYVHGLNTTDWDAIADSGYNTGRLSSPPPNPNPTHLTSPPPFQRTQDVYMLRYHQSYPSCKHTNPLTQNSPPLSVCTTRRDTTRHDTTSITVLTYTNGGLHESYALPTPASVATTTSFLDNAKARNIKVILSIKGYYPDKAPNGKSFS